MKGLGTICVALCAAGLVCADGVLVVKAQRVYPVGRPPMAPAVIRIEDGTITALQTELEPPEGAVVLTAATVIPGIIDALSDVGVEGPSAEQSEEITPSVRVIDCFDPTSPGLVQARSLGITLAHIAPAPRNVVGGLCAVVKTYGAPATTDLLVREAAALSTVLGPEAASGNRARGWGPPRNRFFRRPTTRMAVAQMFRDVLSRAQSDAEDPDLKIVAQCLDGSRPLRVRSGRVLDIRLLIKESKRLGFTPIIEDGWEAYKEAEALAALGIPVILTPDGVGLRLNDPGGDIRLDNAAILAASGVTIALATGGAAVDPLLIGAMAVRHGLSEAEALRALTLTPAELLGVEGERGSIAVGKVADLVLLSGPPFQATTRVAQVIGAGTVVFPVKGGGR